MNVSLARQLVQNQFPKWKDLPITPVEHGGWDHHAFHLGSNKILRFPRDVTYAPQAEKEHRWLPVLAPQLPLQVPKPLGLGKSSDEYPFHFSIYGWIEGEDASHTELPDLCDIAKKLAQFLTALQNIPAGEGPLPGEHNFFRGGDLSKYDSEARKGIHLLRDQIDEEQALRVWETALKTEWKHEPVWVHGDISAGNLLMDQGKLHAVIDFGLLAIGDPACDLAIAWTLFDAESREIFQKSLSVDEGTWQRARGWALWKAVITASGLTKTNAVSEAKALSIVHAIK